MKFVDTGAWYASYVPSDPDHERVTAQIDGAETRLVTSDFVLGESLTLLRTRNEYQRAVLLGKNLLGWNSVELVYLTPDEIAQAFIVFSTYRDKEWSFVDCSSLIVMQRLKITKAISLDHHFRQMPGITVYP
ncbi:MAG: PIN domain-containing protein [Pirellulales bacterium]